MSLVKKSQNVNMDGVRVAPEELPKFMNEDVGDVRMEPEDEALSDHDSVHGAGEVIIVEEPEEIHKEFAFTLPHVPGGDDQDEIEEPAEIEVEEPQDVEVSDDPRKWTVSTFMPWLQNMMNNVPKHSGKDIAGCERAIAHLEFLKRECSKAARSDLNGELDIDAIEKARDEIHKGMERLQDRIDRIESSKRPKKKKKAEYDEQGFIKEAGQPRLGGVMVTVPLLISSLARSCINGMVSAGHDIENIFVKLSKEYDLTKREKLELIQLLSDMNYPIRRDLGMPLDQPIDTTSPDNVNWGAQYSA